MIGIGPSIDAQIASHDGGVPAVQLLPERVAQDHDPFVTRLFFLLGESAAEDGPGAEQREERRRRRLCPDALGNALDLEGAALGAVRGDLLEDAGESAAVEVVGNAVRAPDVGGHTRAGVGVPHGDEPLGLGERQRPQDDRVDEGEDGRIGADAKPEGQGHGEDQPFFPRELPRGELEVLK